MNKKLLSLAVAGSFAASAAVFAQDSNPGVTVNGWGNVVWSLTDEFDEDNEGQFLSDGEVNFDTENLFIALGATTGGGNGSPGDVGVGQIFLKHSFNDQWKIAAGKFDSNLTADAGAAVDRQFTNNSILFTALAAEGADSLQGVAVIAGLGMFNLNVGYVNDDSTDGTGDEKNSVAVRADTSLLDDKLFLEVGYLSQDLNGGDILDVNGTFTFLENGIVGVDFMSLSDGETSVSGLDDATSVWAGWNFGNGFAVKARYEMGSSAVDGVDDTDVTELYASYDLSDNLKVAADWQSVDTGETFDRAMLQLVGTF